MKKKNIENFIKQTETRIRITVEKKGAKNNCSKTSSYISVSVIC